MHHSGMQGSLLTFLHLGNRILWVRTPKTFVALNRVHVADAFTTTALTASDNFLTRSAQVLDVAQPRKPVFPPDAK